MPRIRYGAAHLRNVAARRLVTLAWSEEESMTTSVHEIADRIYRISTPTLACMHGSAWRGDGAQLLRALADALEREE